MDMKRQAVLEHIVAFARGGKAKPISKSIKTKEARAAIPVDRELI